MRKIQIAIRSEIMMTIRKSQCWASLNTKSAEELLLRRYGSKNSHIVDTYVAV